MADEDVDHESKTEDPTPRRREEARRQGQVPFSAELVGSVVLFAAVMAMKSFGPALWGAMSDVFRYDLTHISISEYGTADASTSFLRIILRMMAYLLPLFGMTALVGILVSVAQVGFMINTDKLAPDFDKLNPTNGFGRLFSFASVVRALLTMLKLLALAGIAYWVVGNRAGVILSLNHDRLAGSTAAAWVIVMRLATYLSAAIVLISGLDYFYQRRRFERNLRMTKQELKEELKHEDGDPYIKSRFRQIARERAMKKMLAEVPKATVVITNPTHYAVALRYNGDRDDAPIVSAKGTGPFANRIKTIARDKGIPILERPALARAIYAGVREGKPIPANLFRAVAEVLVFVYKMRGTARP